MDDSSIRKAGLVPDAFRHASVGTIQSSLSTEHTDTEAARETVDEKKNVAKLFGFIGAEIITYVTLKGCFFFHGTLSCLPDCLYYAKKIKK